MNNIWYGFLVVVTVSIPSCQIELEQIVCELISVALKDKKKFIVNRNLAKITMHIKNIEKLPEEVIVVLKHVVISSI